MSRRRLGSFAIIAPRALFVTLAIFIAIILLFRRVSLASILAVALFPLFAWVLHDYGDSPQVLLLMTFSSILIVIKHHQNIGRLLAGTEPRFNWRRA